MNEPLKLAAGARPCVQCGFCCRQAPCPFGTHAPGVRRCAYLIDNRCGIYEQILSLPDDRWHFAPAFGAGCCSALNTDRARIMTKRRAKTIPTPKPPAVTLTPAPNCHPFPHTDISGPLVVEVDMTHDAKTLWVNVNGVCVLRCCQIGHVVIGPRAGTRFDTPSEPLCPVCGKPAVLQYTKGKGRPYLSCNEHKVQAILLEIHGDPRKPKT